LLVLHARSEIGKRMKSDEAIILLTELCLGEKLVKPSLVSINHIGPNGYILRIKANCELEATGKFVQKKHFSLLARALRLFNHFLSHRTEVI